MNACLCLVQGATGGKALLLSSSRREVRLWDVGAMDSGPACGWDDCRGGHFSHAGTVVAAVSSRQSRWAWSCGEMIRGTSVRMGRDGVSSSSEGGLLGGSEQPEAAGV